MVVNTIHGGKNKIKAGRAGPRSWLTWLLYYVGGVAGLVLALLLIGAGRWKWVEKILIRGRRRRGDK